MDTKKAENIQKCWLSEGWKHRKYPYLVTIQLSNSQRFKCRSYVIWELIWDFYISGFPGTNIFNMHHLRLDKLSECSHQQSLLLRIVINMPTNQIPSRSNGLTNEKKNWNMKIRNKNVFIYANMLGFQLRRNLDEIHVNILFFLPENKLIIRV